jgi:hypothetical protein
MSADHNLGGTIRDGADTPESEEVRLEERPDGKRVARESTMAKRQAIVWLASWWAAALAVPFAFLALYQSLTYTPPSDSSNENLVFTVLIVVFMVIVGALMTGETLLVVDTEAQTLEVVRRYLWSIPVWKRAISSCQIEAISVVHVKASAQVQIRVKQSLAPLIVMDRAVGDPYVYKVVEWLQSDLLQR